MSVVGPIAAKKLQGRECSEVFSLQQNSLVIRSSRPDRRTSAIRGTGVTEYWFGLPRQSGLMLAARITLLHFSVSSAMSFPKSAGEPGSGVPPRSTSRALIVGSARAALISLLSVSTISAGVFFGVATPVQKLDS